MSVNLEEKKNIMADQDKQFLENVVKSIVGKPEEVSVERTVDEMGVLLTLKVAQEDMGYVIGRRGQTAQAIRVLLKIVGAKNNARVNLKIYDPEGAQRPARRDGDGDRDRGRGRDRGRDADEVDTSSVDDLKI